MNGWIVGDSGIILNTDDGGVTWTDQNSGTANRLTDVCFVDPEKGWIVGSNGTLLRTLNSGDTWEVE